MGSLKRNAAPRRLPATKPGDLFPQGTHHPPKQLFGHLGRSFTVRVGKPVAARCSCAANARQRSRVQLEAIAQVIKPNASGQLGIDQTHHMAPRLKGARHILRSSSPRDFRNLVWGNKIANLAQDVELRPCWLDRFTFHPCLVAGPRRQPNTFLSKLGGWF
jgi:hypothetical protein